ncbi:cadherin-like protein 26 [Suricata suricatta]|uniref:cadherin-like protein 26 n=1 Tax=Suricata suricatta TaxID=37032 RepID=UPI0011555EC1|nr:cadherin-like protein 26 [Suricata suricatta]
MLGESQRPLRRSKRRWIINTLELNEEDPGPFPKFVGELFSDKSNDDSIMYSIHGAGVDEDPERGLFSVGDHKNGRVYVHRPVDRETTPSFKVYLDVLDRRSGKVLDNSLIFNIRVRDVNDHAPQFPEEEFSVSVKESHDAGQPIFQMLAVDLDQEHTPNSQVFYSLISQTPLLKESGFYINHISGEIRLSGCLDYEMASRFTLLVRATDSGEPPLSSTATVHINVEEGNNHMPTFAQENYKVQISEGRASPGVLRLLVQDGDFPFTSAWRVKFNISHGNEEGHFDILTNPKTNEGILNVIKPLDYEAHPVRRLVITVENEAPLFSCEGGRRRGPREAVASATVRVQVLDTNEPPAFQPRSFVVTELDGAGPGTPLGTFRATDPDTAAGQIRYKLAHDPENWVTVDELSGAVTTRKQVDRESPYVNGSFYRIVALAIDNGLPPQTGTGTLMLFLADVNDNAPTLHPHSRSVEVCESAANKALLLEADDGDLEPFADPFTFELDSSGRNVDDTWKLGENWGRSVELRMLRRLPPGNYLVPLLIRDKQGLSQKQTIHVRVCSCPDGVTCVEPLVAGAGLLARTLVPLFAAFFVLTVAVLLLLRCDFGSEAKGHRGPVPHDEGQQSLITYNDESKAVLMQARPDARDQMLVLLLDEAKAEAKLGAQPPAPQDVHDGLEPAARASNQEYVVLGTPERYRSSLPVVGCGMPFEPRLVRNKYSTPVCQEAVVPRRGPDARPGTMEDALSQRLHGVDALGGDAGHRPRVYAEEGECEAAESLSSLGSWKPES